jgi:uncharacterized integral membrane protein
MAEHRSQPGDTQPAQEPRDLSDQLKLAGSLIAGLALVLFFFQNLQQVDINFLWMEWHTRMIWSLIGSAALGGVGVFLGMWFRRRERRPSAS